MEDSFLRKAAFQDNLSARLFSLLVVLLCGGFINNVEGGSQLFAREVVLDIDENRALPRDVTNEDEAVCLVKVRTQIIG
jgi:hypothetical protein